MFVHEYSDKYFETYEECRDDLISEINSDDIMEHFEHSTYDMISRFLRRKDDKEFLDWLDEEINGAFEKTIDELITEYEEGEVD